MTTKGAEIVSEIERLEGELRRIAHELEQLRRKVEPARTGRTMAFASPASSSPSQAHSKSAPTSEIPATQPSPVSAPAPSPRLKTSTRTIPPSGANTGRRVASPAIALDSDEPPAAPQRGKGDSGRDLGRYGYVNDKPRTSTRR